MKAEAGKLNMWQDPIIAETRALRDEYASQFNYDVDAIYKDLVAKQIEHPERMITFPLRNTTALISMTTDN